MRIGVLALQGCVEPHKPHIEKLGATMVPIRYPNDCVNIDGYILPGGESSAILKLIKIMGLHEVLEKEWKHVPVWGICAGAILIASRVSLPKQSSYGIMDFSVERNAYGAQILSHYTTICDYEVAFIRAPKIIDCSSDIDVIARYKNSPVWVADRHSMATTFHPELNNNYPSPMHNYFINELCRN